MRWVWGILGEEVVMLPWVVQQHGGHGHCKTGCGYCRGCRSHNLGRDGRKLLRKVAGKGTALIAFKVNKGREELGDFFAAFREKGGKKSEEKVKSCSGSCHTAKPLRS